MDAQEEKNNGISLFKIDYEIDGKENAVYSAGIVAYTSEEAVKSLADFLKRNINNFKGFKIDTLSFLGAVHHLSDQVRKEILKGVAAQAAAEKAMAAAVVEEPKKITPKKSILKKD